MNVFSYIACPILIIVPSTKLQQIPIKEQLHVRYDAGNDTVPAFMQLIGHWGVR